MRDDPAAGGRTGRSQRVSDDTILEALADAAENGDRDGLDGGVRASTLATRLPLSAGRINVHLRRLREAGAVVQVWGLGENGRVRRSWLPAGHPDATIGGETDERTLSR